MQDSSSISEWIIGLRDSGDEISALKLWERINPRIGKARSNDSSRCFVSDSADDRLQSCIAVSACLRTVLAKGAMADSCHDVQSHTPRERNSGGRKNHGRSFLVAT